MLNRGSLWRHCKCAVKGSVESTRLAPWTTIQLRREINVPMMASIEQVNDRMNWRLSYNDNEPG